MKKEDMANITRGDYLEIHWLDSYGMSSDFWETIANLKPLCCSHILTVAQVFALDEEMIVVCGAKSDEQVMGRLAIPICSIENFYILKRT